jgi:uncharacterized protein YaaR (DUF327 family)
MDIKKLMQEIHNAPGKEEKECVQEKIKAQFSSLSEEEKEHVRREFISSWDEKIVETKKALEKLSAYC